WTAFGREVQDHRIIENDQQKWDYRHQVLGQNHLSPLQVFAAVKWLEFCYHMRPRRLWAMLRCNNKLWRQQLLWTFFHIGRVWVGEIVEFVWRDVLGSRRRGERAAKPGAGRHEESDCVLDSSLCVPPC